MPSTPAAIAPLSAPPVRARAPGPIARLVGVVLAAAAGVAAVAVAVLFAAVLAVVALLAVLVVLMAFVLARTQRRRRADGPVVLTARWTGYGWDA